jgi:type 1 glutamine amidotransferase
VHKINGQVMCEVTDEDTEMRRPSGLLALQLHAGPPMKVQFRNVLLKPLKAKDKRKIALIAGKPSHGYAGHEHNAGCLLLAKCLNENVPEVHAVAYNGWPEDPNALADAAAIVVFSNGGGGHPILPHLKEVDKLAKRGVGVAMLHYAVEVPKGDPGDLFLDWIGGYFETHWSVNPFWKAKFERFPDHPITRGVKPFEMDDEWYYHMRFRENMEGVTPVLTAVPPDSTRERPDGAHSNNPTVRARKGMPEHVGWAAERPDGGRGFGFTGGHWHWNWANDSFRTVVLNGLVWVAGLEVPPGGVASKTPTLEELEKNQDYPQPKNFDRKRVEDLIQSWQ